MCALPGAARALVALVVGGIVLAGLTDWLFDLPSLFRAMAFVALLVGSGLTAFHMLLAPLFQRCDDLSLAMRIEEQIPELNDALASTVQFLQLEDQVSLADSSSLRQAAIRRTLAVVGNYDFHKVLIQRGARWLALAALVSCLAAGYFLYYDNQFATTAAWRLAEPFGRHTWTSINLDNTPHRVAQGQPYMLRGQLAGIIPAAARLEVEGTLKSEKIVAVKAEGKNARVGSFTAAIDMTQQKGKFRFRLFANDAVYPAGAGQWHEVEVLPPPKFAMLNGVPSPQIELRFPAYTDLASPAPLTPGTKHIEGIAGTHVTYRAAFDQPLEQAWIEFRPDNPAWRLTSFLAPLGQNKLLPAPGALGLGQAVWGQVPAHLDTSQIITMSFVPWISGTYLVHVRDVNGLVKEFEADLRVLQDPLPTIQLQRPTSSMSVVADAEIAFKMTVNDDRFAVREVFIEYRTKNEDNRWLDEGPRRLPLYDHRTFGKLIPDLLSGLALAPLPAPELRLRLQNLEIATKWALKGQFKEGEIVVFQVAADDFCDLFPDRPPGRSHEIELRIVAKAEILRVLDEGLGKAQQELVRLQQLEDEAIKLIKDIQQKKAAKKLTQRELDQLIEAEQLQKQIQERLGSRAEEGLRGELAKLQQTIRDNKVPPSEVRDQIKTLQNELERLAAEELPQIEPSLAEAPRKWPALPAQWAKTRGLWTKLKNIRSKRKKHWMNWRSFSIPGRACIRSRGKPALFWTSRRNCEKMSRRPWMLTTISWGVPRITKHVKRSRKSSRRRWNKEQTPRKTSPSARQAARHDGQGAGEAPR